MDHEGKFLFSVARDECIDSAGKSGEALRVKCPALENLQFYEDQAFAAAVCEKYFERQFLYFFLA